MLTNNEIGNILMNQMDNTDPIGLGLIRVRTTNMMEFRDIFTNLDMLESVSILNEVFDEPYHITLLEAFEKQLERLRKFDIEALAVKINNTYGHFYEKNKNRKCSRCGKVHDYGATSAADSASPSTPECLSKSECVSSHPE